MEKYLVADTYQSMTQVGEPFEKNGKKYITVKEPCSKCGGHGYISHYFHIDKGVCFDCRGTGFFTKEVRIYTEKELNRMNKAKEQRREKAEKERRERQLKKQHEWPARNGFDEDGMTWIFVKGNTYAIKDALKDAGYKFNKQLGWHGPECLNDLPEGYEIYQIGFSEVYEWPFELASEPEFIGAKIIEDAKAKAGCGEFVGEIGERLRALDVQFMREHSFEGAYGQTYVYEFNYKGNVLVWMTSKDVDPDEEVEWFELTGTVKQHKNYKGQNQTYLSRCILKEK